LSTTAVCGASVDDQCSWKLDSSTASTSWSASTASSSGSPTLPAATVRSPAAPSTDASMRTVVVLPLVPVTASHGAAPAGPQPPGQLHLADDLDARGGGGDEQRRVGPPARAR
jgi:hypothetical protein